MSMNKYKIIWSPQAYKDLQSIHFYIKKHLKEKNIANNIVKKILNSILELSYLPEKYVKVQNFYHNEKNIRKMPVNNYVVIYEFNNSTRTSFHFTYFSWYSKLFRKFIINYI